MPQRPCQEQDRNPSGSQFELEPMLRLAAFGVTDWVNAVDAQYRS